MCPFLNSVQDRLASLRRFSECALSPLVFLAMRLVVAHVFLLSGWMKFGFILHHDIDSLYFLFEDTYKVPFLPTKLAAWMGMSGELGFSILLGLGLFARFGALGLIVISGVIYHTDANPLGIYWALICAVIAVQGAGKFSLDALIWCRKKKASVQDQ